MARHALKRVLPYTPEQLFDLVGDVEAYPDFVPWITLMRVANRRTEGEGVSVLDAVAGVGFSFLNERFATRVKRNRPDLQIDVSLLNGPFKRLQNRWTFRSHPQGAEIDFLIDFEFKSKILDMMLHANFDRAVAKLITCFEARAKALYGDAPPA
ncbi:MAG TPA: SRPBCC family protein [Caulobacteraceae bacterium]